MESSITVDSKNISVSENFLDSLASDTSDVAELHQLSPLAQACIEKTIDNITRKFVGGIRNRKNSQANNPNKSIKTAAKDTLKATTAKDVIEASSRGAAWKEMIQKSLSHGICSLKTIKFDGEFTVKNGKPQGLDKVPKKPGVYVVYDKKGEPCYVGDSGNIRNRWYAGHLNEHKQKLKQGEAYKLATELEDGCTVKYIKCESVETAAAIEAHLIRIAKPRVNSKEELKNEQCTRSNQEAKKMKDASGSTMSLASGAVLEGVKQGGYTVLERLISCCLKFLKDEVVDIFKGGKSTLLTRVKRFFKRIWEVLYDIIKKPLDFLKGLFEFIVNSLSETIRKIYNLARNIFELGVSALELYKGSKNMSKRDMVEKISEVIITSACIVIWDALDGVLEANMVMLLPAIKPFAPYISATISAVGFGVSSYYLCKCVPSIVDKILSCETMHHKARFELTKACKTLVSTTEMNLQLTLGLEQYAASTTEICLSTNNHLGKLKKRSLTVKRSEINTDIHLLFEE
ncbi:MAG: hypothetical protein D6732_08115 [Methanobacteriota archaeon]|nr:MAG: hypothetical protein D6732_08115 [Euryarchaeota archaeon]